METIDIFRAVLYIMALILGGLALWYKGNSKLNGKVAALITAAEAEYRDSVKAGGQKFEWVVDQLYRMIPAAIRPFVSRNLVDTVVQSTFNAVEGYAKLQLDKLADKVKVGE